MTMEGKHSLLMTQVFFLALCAVENLIMFMCDGCKVPLDICTYGARGPRDFTGFAMGIILCLRYF